MTDMVWFSTSTTFSGTMTASRDTVWAALADPATVARLTPFVSSIHADGDLWRWEMASLPVLGMAITRASPKRMTFTDRSRIEYTHAPSPGGTERTGVEGACTLTDVEGGTHHAIDLTVHAEL
jgi:carbon monoxide dehydrogenase subunit G